MGIAMTGMVKSVSNVNVLDHTLALHVKLM